MGVNKCMIVFGTLLAIGLAAIVVGFVLLLIFLLPGNDPCARPASLPAGMTGSLMDNGDVLLRWPQPLEAANCNVTYLLQYSVDGGSEFQTRTKQLEHNIFHPRLCSDILVRLWTMSDVDDNTSERFLSFNYTVIPIDALVTSVGVSRIGAELVASWQPPSILAGCSMSYHVEFQSELGTFTAATALTSITVPENVFCFTARVQVATIVGYSRTALAHIGQGQATQLNVNLAISPENRYRLIASWNHPNHETCSMRYNVTRLGQGGQTVVITEPQIIVDIVYCVPELLTIIPSAFDFAYRGEVTLVDITQQPSPDMIGAITLDGVSQQPHVVLLLWAAIPPILGCRMTYQVDFVTELATFSRETTEPHYEITRDLFCFSMTIDIRGNAEGVLGDPTRTTVQYDIDPVQGLQLNPSTNNNALTATWTTNIWEQRCFVAYLVTYEHGNLRESFNTSQATVNFDRAYCATTFVSVRVVFGNSQSIESSASYNAGNPTTLQAAQNIRFSIVGTAATVLWDVARSVSQCNALYTVLGRNNIVGVEDTCEGTTSCQVVLPNFCPFTDFTVRPTSLPGQQAIVRYACM